MTGQELCEAIRRYALQQYGYMARLVLKNWGIRSTGDFGEIVYNLIRIGCMRKTARDRREDFDDVYDFDTAFRQEFRIAPAREPGHEPPRERGNERQRREEPQPPARGRREEALEPQRPEPGAGNEREGRARGDQHREGDP